MQGMHTYVEVEEDHISICKPPSTAANTYRLFKEYLGNALQRFQVRQLPLDSKPAGSVAMF